jgi:glycine cleavage system aminomethyltransferase T
VNRSLYGVRIPGEAPAVGAEVRIDGEVAGVLSSVAGPHGTGDSLGLALLRIDRQEDGRRVEVEDRDALLEALPFREGRVG